MWVSPCNVSPIARLYPTLILPLQRGGDLPNGMSEKTGNQHPRKTRKPPIPLSAVVVPVPVVVERGGYPSQKNQDNKGVGNDRCGQYILLLLKLRIFYEERFKVL